MVKCKTKCNAKPLDTHESDWSNSALSQSRIELLLEHLELSAPPNRPIGELPSYITSSAQVCSVQNQRCAIASRLTHRCKHKHALVVQHLKATCAEISAGQIIFIRSRAVLRFLVHGIGSRA